MLRIKFLGQGHLVSWSRITNWPTFKSVSAFYLITLFSFSLMTDFSPSSLKVEGCTLHPAL